MKPPVLVTLPASSIKTTLTAPAAPAGVFTRSWQRQQLGDIVPVAAGGGHRQRGAVRIGDHVVLRAGSGTIDRARAGFWAARTARRCEPSTTARLQSSCPAWCSSVSSS
jgi:hypothetical protein